MAQSIACDLCNEEEAILMQTSLTDGTVLAVGAVCLPQFFGGAMIGVIGADGHSGPPTKCPTCRRIHELMTTKVTPLTAPAAADPDQEWADAEAAEIAAEQ